jgi:hypothetical protein
MDAMKKLTLVATLLCLIALPLYAAKKKATVKVINQSKWEIHHIYLSSHDDANWGDDQLEDEILSKGDTITLTNIDCDDYDIKVVDEDGDECVIEEVSLCGDDSYWKITDKALLECEGHQ